MKIKVSQNFVYWTFAFFISFVVLQKVNAQVRVSSSVDKSRIKIGDLIRYEVRFNYADGIEIQTPGLGSNLGAFEIRDFEDLPPIENDGGFEKTISYHISTFDTGAYVIPPISIGYTVLADSSEHFLETEPIDIYVESMKPSEAGDIRGLKQQMEIPLDVQRIILLSLAGLLILLALIIAWWYRKKRQHGGLFHKPPPPPRPAHEIALEKLTALEKSGMLAAGAFKDYFSQLSEILREYLEGRFHIPALESTTFEILSALEGLENETLDRQGLHRILELSDLVKFAKFTPQESDGPEGLQFVRKFVHDTMIVTTEQNEDHSAAGSKELAPESQVEEALT